MKFQDHSEVAKKYGVGSSGFWRPEVGTHKFRILTEHEPYGNHWIEEEKRGYVCIGNDKNCKYCLTGNKPRVQFLLWILDRKDGECKLAQLGYSVIKQIGELAVSEDWSFESTPIYDITLKRAGEKLETEYYVQPTPNRDELTEAEKTICTEKIKPVSEIIEKMKEKVVGEQSNDQINTEDIPF